jgi:hypothetical protein
LVVDKGSWKNKVATIVQARLMGAGEIRKEDKEDT